MGREKASLFRVDEHLLLVGAVLAAVFWVVESVLDAFVFGEGDFLDALLPMQLAQLWDRGLLAVVLLVFISYAQSAVSGRRNAGELRSLMGCIVESSDDAVIGKALEGIVTSWSRGAQSIGVYSAEEAVGRLISILGPSDLTDETLALLQRVRRGERADHCETVRIKKDDGLIHVPILTVFPIRIRNRAASSHFLTEA